jgi:hypothetical protein
VGRFGGNLWGLSSAVDNEAISAGRAALAAPRPVRSVVALASDLDQALTHRFGDAPQARDFHDQYVTAAQHHQHRALPARGGESSL